MEKAKNGQVYILRFGPYFHVWNPQVLEASQFAFKPFSEPESSVAEPELLYKKIKFRISTCCMTSSFYFPKKENKILPF